MEYQCGKCKTHKDASQFYFRNGKPSTAWCKECYRDWHRGRYVPKGEANDDPRLCAQCGMVYRPQQRRPSIYCSRPCKSDARNAQIAVQTLASKSERECLHCAGVIPRTARKDAIFCSDRCNSKAHALQRKLRARTGEDGRPGYLRAAVCQRDGWRCGICKKFVDRHADYPDPLAPSLDHVVPVSRGGGNELTNLRLTHLVCNLRRRNLPVEMDAVFR